MKKTESQAPSSSQSSEPTGLVTSKNGTQTLNSSSPRLTIVCVSYKRPAAVHVLIRSLLCQTSQDFVLHMIHDGPDEVMQTIFEAYQEEVGARFKYSMTPTRSNDFGHSLRELGIASASSEYILITNDDNYYVPVAVERFLETFDSLPADGVLCDMVHNYFDYTLFQTKPKKDYVDIGCAVVRTEHALNVGWRDKSHNGDGTYIEDLAALPGFAWAKIPQILFVHN